MAWYDFAIRLAVALFLGALIGLERQWRHRIAGLRTNALVSAGSAMFVMMAALTTGDASPTRVAAQVVSGIGFLGAGVILREGLNVSGLNTAATLWCAAAVGTLAGSGHFAESAIGGLAIVAANLALRPAAHWLAQSSRRPGEESVFYFVATIRAADEGRVRMLLLSMVHEGPFVPLALGREEMPGSARVTISADLAAQPEHEEIIRDLVTHLGQDPGVYRVAWEIKEVPGGRRVPVRNRVINSRPGPGR